MSRPPRIPGFDYRGCYRYFLTICTRERATLFTDAVLVDDVMSQFLRTAIDYDMEITAYCVMPDHAHFLTTGLADNTELLPFVKLGKQHSGWRFRRATGRRLWQEGFYDHVLRSEDATASVVRYILNNPVRAGLVDSPSGYFFWGSQVHSQQALLEFIEGVDEWVPEWKRGRGRV